MIRGFVAGFFTNGVPGYGAGFSHVVVASPVCGVCVFADHDAGFEWMLVVVGFDEVVYGGVVVVFGGEF